MRHGIDGFVDDLREARGDHEHSGYGRLIDALIAVTKDDRHLAALAEAWADREFQRYYTRPLLLLAGWRFLALGDADHPLATETAAHAEAPDLIGRVARALADPALAEVVRGRRVQTNEPGRAYGWGLVAKVLGLPHRRFAVADLGASAGLGLVIDLTGIPFELGAHRVSGVDLPTPERRLGLDIAPIDLRDPEEARWLLACIWPGQPERLARFDGCRRVISQWPAALPPVELQPHELGTGATLEALEALEADPAVETVIAFESVVRGYLSEAQRAGYTAELQRWLAGNPRRIWVTLNPAPPTPWGGGPMQLDAHLVRGGELRSIALARSGYHQAGGMLIPGAVAKLYATWGSP